MNLTDKLTQKQLDNLRREMVELSGIPEEWETPEDISAELQIISLIDEVEAYRRAEASKGGAA